MFGGSVKSNDKFLKTLGEAGLHPFVGGFRQLNIYKLSQLQAMSIQEIGEAGVKINMPGPAINRLLEVLGKVEKPTEKKVVIKKSKAKAATSAPATSPSTSAAPEVSKSQVTESSYYHFQSTPKHMARQFDAKQVENPDVAKFKIAAHASSWNPGNTVETREYCDQVQSWVKERLDGFEVVPGVVLSGCKFTGSDSDKTLSVVVNRGKIKCIYDFTIEAKWKTPGEDGKEIEGKLSISDIQPDDDDWFVECNSKNRSDRTKIIIKQIKSDCAEKLNSAIFIPMMHHFKERVKSGR